MSPTEIAQTIWSLAKDYWIVPLGMIALYYYGWAHFNSPDYAIEQDPQDEALERARLLSPAPPIFTTYRSRYRKYGRRYVVMLEVIFLVVIFFPHLVETASKLAATTAIPASLPTENLEYRALWALFGLTGLLASAPGLKDIDAWIMKKLHQAALIPEQARLMADRLFDSQFIVSPEVAEKIKEDLKLRDTRRVAEGKAKGQLETKLLRMRWLRNQLQEAFADDKYAHFKVKLDRDIKEVLKISGELQRDVRTYFLDQAATVPEATLDIDDYISGELDKLRAEGESLQKDLLERLDERRRLIIAKCDSLYYRLCLITALMVLATERNASATQTALRRIGFQVGVNVQATTDWHTVVMLSAALFTVLILLNVIFAVAVWEFQLNMPDFGDRNRILFYSSLETALFAIAIIIAMLVKKYGSTKLGQANWVNIIVAASAFLSTAVFYALIQYFLIRHYLTTAPVLFAFQQAIVGYFIGLYIDRALTKPQLSLKLAFVQAGCQFVAALIAAGLSPPPESNLTVTQSAVLAIISAAEYAVIGILIGVLFQYLYRVVEAPSGKADLRVEIRDEPQAVPTTALPRSYNPPRLGGETLR